VLDVLDPHALRAPDEHRVGVGRVDDVVDLEAELARLFDVLLGGLDPDGEVIQERALGIPRLAVVELDERAADLDHVALRSADPQATASEYGSLGFRAAAPGSSGCPRVEVGGAWVEFQPGEPGAPERPLLNHLAVLVDSAEEHVAAARDLGVEIDDVVDAPNTLAVFLWGPERVRIEYVEHKPTFSLT